MNNLIGPPAELHMTVTIIRAKDGTRETYELVGHCSVEEAQVLGAVEVKSTSPAQE